MTGVATKFRIADLVFDRLISQGDPAANLLADAEVKKFAYLGAMGSSFADLVASRPDISTGAPNTPLFDAWRPIFGMLAGTPTVGGAAGLAGLFRDLSQLRATLRKLQGVIASEDKFALIGIFDEVKALPDVITDLQAIIAAVSAQRIAVGRAILQGRPKDKVLPSSEWWPRDSINGSSTGRFVSAVRKLADASGDDRLKAYALGSAVGYAADLCGNPYIDSVVGAPYRNHWWRHRWVANYVDAWVYGYYESGGALKVQIRGTGVPDPLYTNWPSLCRADLHGRIGLAGTAAEPILDAIRDSTPLPSLLPQAFVDFWKAAYTETYGAPPPTSGVDDAGIQSAYATSWLTLWFATSDAVLPCMPLDQVNYPDDCGSRPPWVAADGSTVVGGTVVTPPMPSSDPDPDVAEEISGVALAILGLASMFFGNIGGGIAMIIGGIALVVDGATEPNWSELRCFAGWTEVYLYNLTHAMHELLKLSGFGYPYATELAHNGLAAQFGLGVTPPDAALATVRSQGPSDLYPASRWRATASDWPRFPTEPLEPPAENAYPRDPTWPYHFVDGFEFVTPPAGLPVTPNQLNPLAPSPSGASSLVLADDERIARLGRLNDQRATTGFFGNAVEVSLELITRAPLEGILDWDLDGDAGIGYPTWVLPAPGASRSSSIPE